MIIHAKNVRGLGALLLTQKLVKLLELDITLLLSSAELSQLIQKEKTSLNINSFQFSYLSRLWELLFKKYNYGQAATLVMGDIPLKMASPQILYFHNQNIIDDIRVRDFATLKLKLNQLLFCRNLQYVDKFIVQTEHQRKNLNRYLIRLGLFDFQEKVFCVPFSPKKTILRDTTRTEAINLFYPARYYPHKNHDFLFSVFFDVKHKFPKAKLILTIEPNQSPWAEIETIGEISSDLVKRIMDDDNTVLVFPSLKESLGIPLIEALELDIPIIVADLEYAREICGQKVIYFDPHCKNSFLEALSKLKNDINIDRKKKNLNLYETQSNFIKKIVKSVS